MTSTVKTNASTYRTRRRLREALLSLAEREDVSAITVNDVTEQAELNRSTFYLHYPDMDAFVDDVLTQLVDALEEGGRRLLEGQEYGTDEWQETFFRRIGERPELFRRLMMGSDRGSFVTRVLTMHEQWFLQMWKRAGYQEPEHGPSLHVRAKFVAAGVHGLTLHWLESGMTESPETVCEWAFNLGISTGFASSHGDAVSQTSGR